MHILMQNPFRKLNRAAFSGEMHCPFCSRHVDPTTTPIGFENEKTKLRLLESVGPFIRRYICKLCGGIWRYDINSKQLSPYSSFKRGLRNNINIPGVRYSGRVPLLKK